VPGARVRRRPQSRHDHHSTQELCRYQPIARASGEKRVVVVRFVHNDRLVDASTCRRSRPCRLLRGPRLLRQPTSARSRSRVCLTAARHPARRRPARTVRESRTRYDDETTACTPRPADRCLTPRLLGLSTRRCGRCIRGRSRTASPACPHLGLARVGGPRRRHAYAHRRRLDGDDTACWVSSTPGSPVGYLLQVGCVVSAHSQASPPACAGAPTVTREVPCPDTCAAELMGPDRLWGRSTTEKCSPGSRSRPN